ncbi:MAG TPA: porin [Vicinamibacterales bacterium]|nr:porin [Vicinamibacterales bacterium]
MAGPAIRQHGVPNHPFQRPRLRAASAALVVFLAGTVTAGAQVLITVNDDVNFRLGVLGQFQADWLENPGADATANLFIRRVRLLFGGQVARNVSFFVETDAPNLGRVLPGGKNISPGVIVQDAYAEFRAGDWLMVDAGLMFVPFSRQSVQSAASLLALDYGAYTFAHSGPTQSSVGRDTGFQARGYFLGNRLEYRAGAFQGAEGPGPGRSLRFTGRLQYQFLEAEGTGYFYTGTYLGAKRVAAAGAAFDAQEDYRAYNVDVFIDHPLGPGAVTAQLAYNHYDGAGTLRTLPEQDIVLLELGYFLPGPKLTPVVQFTRRNGREGGVADDTRWSVGLNYWLHRHNANVKAAYGRIEPQGAAARGQFTIQLQMFYF